MLGYPTRIVRVTPAGDPVTAKPMSPDDVPGGILATALAAWTGHDDPLVDCDADDVETAATILAAAIPAIRAQAIRAERERLAAMLHERAQQSRTLTHRAVFGIASRLVAPDITPEDIERAIRAGNFVVCDIPDDPDRGDS